jgi:tRNA A-37 threonylcarbamoyl transferase component Bud32
MNKGDRFADRFMILELAGSGGTASVYRAYDEGSKTVVALKIFSTDGADPDVVAEFWNREVKSLSSLAHASVAKLVSAGRDPSTSKRYIILEWIDGLSLESYLTDAGRLSWEEFYETLGIQLLTALVHAAERNISHRDLSTSNVLVTAAGAVKIIDFGQARVSNIGIGRTVAGWRTAPYCPPEEDTGTYTYTRDPYSFCAITVRACAGHKIKDHDALYAAFDTLVIPDSVRNVLKRGLSRDPRQRYPNSIDLQLALEGAPEAQAREEGIELVLPIRLAPGVVDRVRIVGDEDEETASDSLIRELNDSVSIVPAPSELGQRDNRRMELETQAHRVIVDIDSVQNDHLVVVGVVQKRFRLDTLYHSERWMPRVRFISSLPRRVDQCDAAKSAIAALYEGLEEFQTSLFVQRRQSGVAVSEWGRLLEALRYIARHEVPPLRYVKIDSEGALLTATVENSEGADEEQIRTISVEGRWVFRGEIASVVGDQCLLLSTRPRIDLAAIPRQGSLEIDWQQTKVALDRQARAVERFKSGDLPSPALGKLLTGEESGSNDPIFAQVNFFYDPALDVAKKSIVSRCAHGAELLVIHGPPGTGKTKLIVELVRQCLKASAQARVLLVSQTHAALDNALERLLKLDPDASCVRIGSGSKAIDQRVAKCTVEERGKILRGAVEVGSQRYVEERAEVLGVSREEVELGLRALDVCGLNSRLADVLRRKADLEAELQRVNESGSQGNSEERSTRKLRLNSLQDNLDRIDTQLQLLEAEQAVAKEKLASLGPQGAELADGTDSDLRQWADMLTAGEGRQALGELMQLAEDWRLRFGQSDDFKAAIIAASSIVAGTCVGFCREEAASRTTFDLCIVDEAGKATTTELLVPLTQSRRAVIVGDHHQLPAVIDHAIKDPELMERFGITPDQIRTQLFEKLIGELAPGCLAGLKVQYRMRTAIGALVSTCFYDGELETDASANERFVVDLSIAGITSAVTWVNPYVGLTAERYEQRAGTSFASTPEVQCIVSLLRRIVFVFEHSDLSSNWPSVAVITGYASQARQIRTEIRRDTTLDQLGVECATVHAFQGREVDICIYSVARRNKEHRIGMLSDWRHLNVALSRARDYLVIVGDIAFCRDVPEPNPFAPIVEFIQHSPDCAIKDWHDD